MTKSKKKKSKLISFLKNHLRLYGKWVGRDKIKDGDSVDDMVDKVKDNAEVGFKINFKF